jgi:3-deoxy-7-phosphoheptulonate synthase
MRHDATPEDIQGVVNTMEEMGYEARPMPGKQRTAIGLVGNDGKVNADRLESLSG